MEFQVLCPAPDRSLTAPVPPGWLKARAFYFHRFFSHQPDLNYDHAPVRDEMRKVLRFWLEMGVDGLCLNGAACLFKR